LVIWFFNNCGHIYIGLPCILHIWELSLHIKIGSQNFENQWLCIGIPLRSVNYQFPVLITTNMGSNFKPREGEGQKRTMTKSQNWFLDFWEPWLHIWNSLLFGKFFGATMVMYIWESATELLSLPVLITTHQIANLKREAEGTQVTPRIGFQNFFRTMVIYIYIYIWTPIRTPGYQFSF
jgi:hypothetical protein